ncbi:MAG: glycosyltransferase family 39 protein [Deltaproteobacteria bacterium]
MEILTKLLTPYEGIARWTERRKLLSLLGIAFVLRLYLVITARGIDPDAVAYLSIAKNFIDRDYYHAFSNVFPPFYPFLTALLFPFTGDFELAGRIVSAILGTLTILPIFYLGKRLFGETITMFSVLLAVFQPYLVRFSGSVLTESTYTFLVALAVLVGWKGLDSRSKGLMFLLGVLLGLAYLTRPEGIGFVILFFPWILFFDGPRFWLHLRRKCSMLFLLMAGVLILALPYILFLHEVTGRWILSRKVGF